MEKTEDNILLVRASSDASDANNDATHPNNTTVLELDTTGWEEESAVRSFSFVMDFPKEKHIKSMEKVNDRTALEEDDDDEVDQSGVGMTMTMTMTSWDVTPPIKIPVLYRNSYTKLKFLMGGVTSQPTRSERRRYYSFQKS